MNPNEVKTPRTRAAEGEMVEIRTGLRGMAVFSSVAERLERELIAANEDRERLRAAGLDESNRLLAANERAEKAEALARELGEALKRTLSYIKHPEGSEPSGLRYISTCALLRDTLAKLDAALPKDQP